LRKLLPNDWWLPFWNTVYILNTRNINALIHSQPLFNIITSPSEDIPHCIKLSATATVTDIHICSISPQDTVGDFNIRIDRSFKLQLI